MSGSQDSTVRLWDAAIGAALQMLQGHSDLVSSVAFSPDGKLVMSGSHDGTVQLWDAATGEALQTLEGHSDEVTSVAFSLDGKLVVSRSHDRTVRLWDTAIGAALQTLEGQVVHALYLSNDWLVEKGGNILWLPPDYRATCVTVWNGIVALGHSLGRISILEFKKGSKLI